MEITIKGIWQLLKQAGSGFIKDKVPKLSASLAYYTIFSLGPIVIVILFLTTLFLSRQAAEGTIFNQTKALIGNRAALQIQEIIKNASISKSNTIAAIAGFVMLFIGATTVFSEIHDSINMIWKLRVKAKKGWMKVLITRLWSFSMIVSMGFLLLVSLFVNTVIESLMGKLRNVFPENSVVIIYILNLFFTLLIISILFALIYKVLPDAIIRWRDVAVGALFTGLLFMIGKFGITFYISKSDFGSSYGAAGSLAVLFVWVYFSAMILYFGAELTKAYALKYGSEIRPNDFAETIQIVQVKSHKRSVQDNENDTENTKRVLQKTKDNIEFGNKL